jgi:hypothetical protein
VRNATFPGHALSWRFHAPASEESLAVLIPDATRTALTILAYALDDAPVRATLTGGDLEPGTWELTQGIDTDGDDVADQGLATRTVELGRSESIELTFAPRTMTVIKLARKTPGTPYWERPDLGIDPQDVDVRDGVVQVSVHSLGSVPAPATAVALVDAQGQEIATAALSALAAPLDLLPKTASVRLRLPSGASPEGMKVVIDPRRTLTEITRRNNVVALPGASR